MAIKESIVQRRDACVESIKNSENFLEEQKHHYIEMVCNAAEGTNGLNQQDKLQNVSESSFERTTMMIGVEEKLLVLENKLGNNKTAIESIKEQLQDNTTNLSKSLSEISEQIKNLENQKTSCDQKFIQIASKLQPPTPTPASTPQPTTKSKIDVENLNWKNLIKLILIKPWIWLAISFISFSPKCLDILQLILTKFT